jgi:hypothetical protein
MADIIPEKEHSYLIACLQYAPERREPYYYLAQYFFKKGDCILASHYAKQALEHTVSRFDVFNNKEVWTGGVEKLQADIEECYNKNNKRIKK